MGTPSASQDLQGLPDSLPVFPLPGVLLLPGGRLPLNVFEPRYLAMVRDALAGPRLIGMVQPERADHFLEDEGAGEDAGSARIYPIGCAGRIVTFSETDDGRYLVTLKGLIRFRVARELPQTEGYRRVAPEFAPFADDLKESSGSFDRDRLLYALERYFEQQEIEADWDSVTAAPDDRLVTSLSMVCPLPPAEKQALLEAPDLAARAGTLTTILEMAVLEEAAGTDGGMARH